MEEESELFDEQLLIGRNILIQGTAGSYNIEKIDRDMDVLTLMRNDGLSVEFDNIDYVFETAYFSDSDGPEDELCMYGEVNRLGLGARHDED